jgi:hypothetical protein
VLVLLFGMRGCFFLRMPLRLLRHVVSIEHPVDVRAGLAPALAKRRLAVPFATAVQFSGVVSR